MRIVYLTSGAAGMICGSCLNDNTLARTLRNRGVDIQLVPTYTPIRTDEEDVSISRVFYGGVNVYLQQKVPPFRWLPRWMTGWLDRRGLLDWATSRGLETSATELGALTLSMLRGVDGNQRQEVEKLCDWLAAEARPQLVHLSNVLIGGCLPTLVDRLKVPIVVTLQGDDIFLDYLPEPYQSQAYDRARMLVQHVDAFVVHSKFYASLMGPRLRIPPDRIHQLPLGISTQEFANSPAEASQRGASNLTIGYLARLAPEKGLANLVDAFIRIRSLDAKSKPKLRIAGWLGNRNRSYADEQFKKLSAAGLDGEWEYVGEVDRKRKIEFLNSLDVFCVPTNYAEPKGLYVLEALAAGVPVLVPSHGAFPELAESTGGVKLYRAGDGDDLVQELRNLLEDESLRRRHGQAGMSAVNEKYSAEVAADQTAKLYERLLGNV